MSLFQRFFAIAALILIFQSLLTGFLVIQQVREQDNRYAVSELDESSRLVYENFNNWKRVLWQQLVGFSQEGSPDSLVRELSTRRTVDWVVVSQHGGAASQVHGLTGRPYPRGLQRDWNAPPAPRVTIDYREGTLLLRGSRAVESGDGSVTAIHLLKLVDAGFCQQLAVDTPGTATFVTGFGALPELPSLPNTDTFERTAEGRRGYARILDGRTAAGERYNGSLRNAGIVLSESGPSSLYLAVVMDGSWQDQRLHTIFRSLLLASLFSLALSAALVLFGSWTISKPIVRLGEALEQVAGGDYSVRLADSGGRETRALFSGFNRMAAQLEQDVREREEHVEEITALTTTNETIFQSLGTGMITVAPDFRILRVNSAASELLQRKEPELHGTPLQELEAPGLQEHLMEIAVEVFRDQKEVTGRVRRAGGRAYQIGGFLLRGREFLEELVMEGCLILVEDVTEKVSVEERMVRAEKLSSLAILTAGVAHEINNPLSSITTNVQNIASEIDDPEQKRAIDYIQQETRRIRNIVGRLLEFAGKNNGEQSSADLNDEIRLVLANVRYSFPEHATGAVTTELADSLPPAAIPADELRQMLLNLLSNAFRAIVEREDGGGTVTVRTDREDGVVILEVADNGTGIPEEEQGRIFDPFYTTKADGSGLGLSVVYGLLNRRGGTCSLSSAQGEGTTVTLTLPIGRDSTA